MPRIEPFERFPDHYDEWFVVHGPEYERELEAVRQLMPAGGRALEVGVGSGRFAAPLDVGFGVEPSWTMARRAMARGVQVVQGVAEALPIGSGAVDVVLMVTTICFVDSLSMSLREAWRVLRNGGRIVVGFVDRESELGHAYLRRKDRSRFYRSAVFYSTAEVIESLQRAGFDGIVARQTLLPEEGGERVIEGTGIGSFVVLRAEKNR